MKMSGQRSLLVFLLSLVLLCITAESAASLKVRKAHAKGMRGAMTKGAQEPAEKEEEKKDEKDAAAEDEDDDDDDDDEEEEQAAPKSEGNPHAAEEAELKKAIAQKQKELDENVKQQAELKADIAKVSDEQAVNKEIDTDVKQVANETDSKAMATMLGKMWKEMRMLNLPFYSKHVEEEIHDLKRDEKRLEEEITAAQAKLTEAKKKWANEGKEESKDKKAEGEKGEAAATASVSKDKKAEGEKGEAQDETELKEEGAEQRKKEPFPHEQAHDAAAKAAKNDEEELKRWSFWHMAPPQQRAVLMSTLTYLICGCLLALVYSKARTRPQYQKYFDPKARSDLQVSKDEFSNGLFGCFNNPNVCLFGFCCPVIRWADTVARKDLLAFWPAFFLMFILMLLHPYTFALTNVAIFLVGAMYRQKLRQAYGLKKGGRTVLFDILAWMCCQPCAIVQEAQQEALPP